MLPLTSIVPAAISQPLKGAALPHPWMSTSGTDRSEDGEDGVSGLPGYVSTNTIPLGGGDVKLTFPPRLVGGWCVPRAFANDLRVAMTEWLWGVASQEGVV